MRIVTQGHEPGGNVAHDRAATLAEGRRRAASNGGCASPGRSVATLSRCRAQRGTPAQCLPPPRCDLWSAGARGVDRSLRRRPARPVPRRPHRHRHRLLALHLRPGGADAPAPTAGTRRRRAGRYRHRGRRRSTTHRPPLCGRQPGARRARSVRPVALDDALPGRWRAASAGGPSRRPGRHRLRAHRARPRRCRRAPRSPRRRGGAGRARAATHPRRGRRPDRLRLHRRRRGRPALRHRGAAHHRLGHRGPAPSRDFGPYRRPAPADARARARRRRCPVRLRSRGGPCGRPLRRGR